MFMHIVSFDLNNTPVRSAATCKRPLNSKISISLAQEVFEVYHYRFVTRSKNYNVHLPLTYARLLLLKGFSLQTFCFFSGHRTLYVGVRMPLGRQSHRHHRPHGQKHRRRGRGKGAGQGEEGPEALAHGITPGREGGCPWLGGLVRLRDIKQMVLILYPFCKVFRVCFQEEKMLIRIKSISENYTIQAFKSIPL